MPDQFIAGDQINMSGSGNVGKVVRSPASPGASTAASSGTFFVSYSRVDAARVQPLARELTSFGLDTWVDEAALTGGEMWRDRIASTIGSARGVIAMFSQQSVSRLWSEQAAEILAARDIRMVRPLAVIPVRLEECQVPDMPIGPGTKTLHDLHFVDVFSNAPSAIAPLVRALHAVR